MIVGIFGAVCVLLFVYACAGLVQGAVLPRPLIGDPRKPPYRVLRIQMRGRALEGNQGANPNGMTIYRDLYLTCDYGPGPMNPCNPVSNSQASKISLVQGILAAGTTATVVPAGVTIAGGAITGLALTAPSFGGAGYNILVPPLVMITDSAGGVGAYAVATVSPAGVITGINVLYGGVGYVLAATVTVTITAPNASGFQGMVANQLIKKAFATTYINNGIYAQWIDTPTDKNVQVGSPTVLGGVGVVPAGGFLTPTGDGGVAQPRLPLDNNVTVTKYTGEQGRSWSGHAWHPSCVPTTFFTGDSLNAVGIAAWNAIKACLYMPITDGTAVLYPIQISVTLSEFEGNPRKITYAPLILPGLDPVRGIYNPLVNSTLGEEKRRREKHGLAV